MKISNEGIALLLSLFVSVSASPDAVLDTSGISTAQPLLPAEFTITDGVAQPADRVAPLGVNSWGGSGGLEYAANNFVRNPGNEPIYWRNLHRVMKTEENWFEIDGPGTSWWNLWNSGFLSGATVRIYRLVDRDGNPLPLNKRGNYLDIDLADHVKFVGRSTVIPARSPGFPDGGWLANKYTPVNPNGWIRHGNLSATDCLGLENGRTYWYALAALNTAGRESPLSNEVSVTIHPNAADPPRLMVSRGEDLLSGLKPEKGFSFLPKVNGGTPPFHWSVVDAKGAPFSLPEGLRLDPSRGRIGGKVHTAPQDQKFWLKVVDSRGQSDRRAWTFNPAKPDGVGQNPLPDPPSGLTGPALKGCTTLTWKASRTPGVAGYQLKRSTVPLAQQVSRVYLVKGAPRVAPFDYVVVEKKFLNFDMSFVNPRVRGMGNAVDVPGWYWDGDGLSFSLVPHPGPIPREMIDPGETCLQVDAEAGPRTMGQNVFVGTARGRESIWYGQLEPGKSYRLEVWLRQKGLAGGGAVSFSYGSAYPGIRKIFHVSNRWQRFTYDFTGPERPRDLSHFGHQFEFTGPGTLWLDNARIFRYEHPADREQAYLPNTTVLSELMASQPDQGRKGDHRIWFLGRNATMDSLLSWHANSRVRVDWRTAVSSTLDMTLPMALRFDLQTGSGPHTRMRPWLVLQHLIHSEQDWLNLIEFLAAPYDPAKDTPRSKPWAYRRYQQRGVGTPWTEEFDRLTFEFGNETWHNGVFDDFIGFSMRNNVHQGGAEYGLFACYLIATMKASPYWKPMRLDEKIRFAVGANYDGRIDVHGSVHGYGEEAMQKCPQVNVLGHANYVGPKWEKGEKTSDQFDDNGIQRILLAFASGNKPLQLSMSRSREALAATHPYDLVAYEGGPSGFNLPGKASPVKEEIGERYGKSLAIGVAALDAWLGSYALGWIDQCYYQFGQGPNWNSHTPFSEGFRPSPAWLAMTLRNRYASGDLMKVMAQSGPTVRLGKETYPLIEVYALRDGRRWSLFVLSRKLNGQNDGVDFGDGFTPVTLHLPFTRAKKVTLYSLSGDPRETNLKSQAIGIRSQPIPPERMKGSLVIGPQTGGAAGGMPPGSVFLYVLEDAQ